MVYKSYPRLGDGNICGNIILVRDTTSLQKLSPFRGRKLNTTKFYNCSSRQFTKANPVKGTETLSHTIEPIAQSTPFTKANPVKGTETLLPRVSPSNPLKQFTKANPVKGTET